MQTLFHIQKLLYWLERLDSYNISVGGRGGVGRGTIERDWLEGLGHWLYWNMLPLLVGMGLAMASDSSASIKSALAVGTSFSPTSCVAVSALKVRVLLLLLTSCGRYWV